MYGIYILATQFLCAMASIIPWTMGFYVFLLQIDKIFHKKINWLKKKCIIIVCVFLFWKFYYSWLIFNGTFPGKCQQAMFVKRFGIFEGCRVFFYCF